MEFLASPRKEMGMEMVLLTLLSALSFQWKAPPPATLERSHPLQFHLHSQKLFHIHNVSQWYTLLDTYFVYFSPIF